jgi:hypothetical protein
LGDYSHAECVYTNAYGDFSHAEGEGSVVQSSFTISGNAGATEYVSSQDHGLTVGSVIRY